MICMTFKANNTTLRGRLSKMLYPGREMPAFPQRPSKEKVVNETLMVGHPDMLPVDTLLVAGPGLSRHLKPQKPIIILNGPNVSYSNSPIYVKGGYIQVVEDFITLRVISYSEDDSPAVVIPNLIDHYCGVHGALISDSHFMGGGVLVGAGSHHRITGSVAHGEYPLVVVDPGRMDPSILVTITHSTSRRLLCVARGKCTHICHRKNHHQSIFPVKTKDGAKHSKRIP